MHPGIKFYEAFFNNLSVIENYKKAVCLVCYYNKVLVAHKGDILDTAVDNEQLKKMFQCMEYSLNWLKYFKKILGFKKNAFLNEVSFIGCTFTNGKIIGEPDKAFEFAQKWIDDFPKTNDYVKYEVAIYVMSYKF